MTTNKPKYPNADTSAERLREIEESFLRDKRARDVIPEWLEKMRREMNGHPAVKMYDLLAMLHEQRWRKMDPNEVKTEPVEVRWFEERKAFYWRPIPPLPTE